MSYDGGVPIDHAPPGEPPSSSLSCKSAPYRQTLRCVLCTLRSGIGWQGLTKDAVALDPVSKMCHATL